jgi:hypothetical protein
MRYYLLASCVDKIKTFCLLCLVDEVHTKKMIYRVLLDSTIGPEVVTEHGPT